MLEEISDGAVAVDVDPSGVEGAPSLGVVEDASVVALPCVDVVTCAGAGAAIAFEITDFISVSSGAFSMRSVKTTDEVASVYFDAGR